MTEQIFFYQTNNANTNYTLDVLATVSSANFSSISAVPPPLPPLTVCLSLQSPLHAKPTNMPSVSATLL